MKVKHYLPFLFLSLGLFGTYAQDSLVLEVDSSIISQRGAVHIEKDTLFYLYQSIEEITAKERAKLTCQRLTSIIALSEFKPKDLKVKDTLDASFITYDSLYLVRLTKLDANAAGLVDVHQHASAMRDKIEKSITAHRVHHGFRGLLIQIGLSIAVVIIFVVIVVMTNRLFRWLKLKVHVSESHYLDGISVRKYELLGKERLHALLLVILNILRVVFLVVVFYFTLPVILNIFPWTKGIADLLIGVVLDPLKNIVNEMVDFIPNLFTIALIFGVIRFFIRGINHIANDIKKEKLKITGFYPDWAVPTARIINVFLYAFMLVLIWPYLPGSDSPVFKGVTVFFGLLVTLGSSSAISNLVSGIVITYMRPFQIGHRIKLGDVLGDVVEKNLLVTRIKTIKNEIVTVPNSQVMAGNSVNYSLSSQESGGLIINTEVTIGYDVNWRLVHRMLKQAAAKTPLLKEDPPPFVLQRSLDDFYVRYQINAYTQSPQDQAVIYSDLHALIQDEFARNDVEIMSPHHRAHRDGPSTVPLPPEHTGATKPQKSSTDLLKEAEKEEKANQSPPEEQNPKG